MRHLALALLLSVLPAQSLPFVPTGWLRLFLGPAATCTTCPAWWVDEFVWPTGAPPSDEAWGSYTTTQGGGSGTCVQTTGCAQSGPCTAWTSVSITVNSGYILDIAGQHYAGPQVYQQSFGVPGGLCGWNGAFEGSIYRGGNPWVFIGWVRVRVGCGVCQ